MKIIKAGYKQTEIGIIPEDWEVKNLSESLVYEQPTKYIVISTEYTEYANIAVLTANKSFILGYTNEDFGIFNNTPVIIFDDFTTASKYVDFKFKVKSSALKILKLRNKNFDLKYLFEQMQIVNFHISDHKRYWISEYQNIKIPYPPLLEQIAIAEALSDVDVLIEGLDLLLRKKRDMKTATMQQLLSGKTRLSGFNGEWKTRKVGELGQIITGSTPSTFIPKYWDGDIAWVTPTDIGLQKNIKDTDRKITNFGLAVSRKLPVNAVLVTCIASIGKNAILSVTGGCNQQINAIIANENFNHDYLYYLMEGNKEYLKRNAGITATSIISKKTFSNMMFFLPPLLEQIAIATILSDMDNEIEAIEKRITKTKSLKTGMMQELLTGKIRLLTKKS